MPINALATRALMSCRQAVMASQSASVPGFPFTSVIPVSMTLDGQVIALLGETAQHTRNITIDPRISMLLHDDLEDNWQAATRLSVLGRMRPLAADIANFDQLKESFYLLHPELTDFDSAPDFHFWVLDSVQFRFTTGCDKPQWIDQIKPDLLELTSSDRLKFNDILVQQGIQGHIVQATRYGLQIIANGRVRFLSLAEPVDQISELFELISARQFDDPALID